MIHGAGPIQKYARERISETLLQSERIPQLGLSVGVLQADETQSELFTDDGGADG